MDIIGSNLLIWEYDVESNMFTFSTPNQPSKAVPFRAVERFVKVYISEDYQDHLLSQFTKSNTNELKSVVEISDYNGYRLTYKLSGYSPSGSKRRGQFELISKIPLLFESKVAFNALLSDVRKSVVITNEKFDILMSNKVFQSTFKINGSGYIGNNIAQVLVGVNNEHIFAEIKQELVNANRWSGLFLSKDAIDNFLLHDLEVVKFSLNERDTFYAFRWTLLAGNKNYKTVANYDYTIKDVDVANAKEFRKRAKENVAPDVCYMCISLLPDFNATNRDRNQVSLALGLKNMYQSDNIGYFGEGVFVVLVEANMDDLLAMGGLSRMVRRFKRKLRGEVEDKIYRSVLNGKVGIDLLGIDSSSIDETITNSLLALDTHDTETAKFNLFDQEVYKESYRRRRLEALVVNVIRTRQLDVHFQPVVSLRTGRIAKFEALCRFPQLAQEFGVQEMVLAAERLGVVHTLDKLVCEKAMSYFQRILSRCEDEVQLSVNCSLLDEEHGLQYLSDLFNLIQTSTNKPNQVGIEITESSYFANSLNNSNLINTIRNKGVQVFVDDFGTGNSSFSYFNDFQFDVLKIDRNFIQDIHQVRQKYFAVKMLVELSHELGISVVAEGVECNEELEILKEFDVDFVQGYLFSKPLSMEAIMEVDEVNDLIQVDSNLDLAYQNVS
ncbi:EAL domain-containing protein [Vibrio ishigakensis]|uniref:EAL domain-containing protein n=1 Tax=Vibrio ishigakensis TaxID=1481914 RepID=UPI0021C42091|nr:EAL domain-containing protein [Vibrio ishigakensis]